MRKACRLRAVLSRPTRRRGAHALNFLFHAVTCRHELMRETTMPLAIVTGGGGALGKGICLALNARGWRVAVADMVREFAEETAAAIAASAPIVKLLDVTDLAAVRKTFAEI